MTKSLFIQRDRPNPERHWIICLGLALNLAGCASSPGPEQTRAVPAPVQTALAGLKPVQIETAVELRLGHEVGRTEVISHLSRSLSESLEKGVPRKRLEDETSFRVQSKVIAFDEAAGRIGQQVRTVSKEGSLDLRLLGFPEKGENLDLWLTPKAKVLKAGRYPSNSLFFVPPVSLPDGAVRIGDTWTAKARWWSLEDGTAFELEMVSILKGFVACGERDVCADIEVSGEVGLPGTINELIAFRNRWAGRLLFARDAGTVVWSRVDSIEIMEADSVVRRMQSCLESVLVEPRTGQIADVAPACAPEATPSSLLP